MNRKDLVRVIAESIRALLLVVVALLAAGCDDMQTDFVLRVIDADGPPVPGARVERVFFSAQPNRQRLELPQPHEPIQSQSIAINDTYCY